MYLIIICKYNVYVLYLGKTNESTILLLNPTSIVRGLTDKHNLLYSSVNYILVDKEFWRLRNIDIYVCVCVCMYTLFFSFRCIILIESMRYAYTSWSTRENKLYNIISQLVLPITFSLPCSACLFLDATSIVKFRLIWKEDEAGRNW